MQTDIGATSTPARAALLVGGALLLFWGVLHTFKYGFQPGSYLACGTAFALLTLRLVDHATRAHPDRASTRTRVAVSIGLALMWPVMLVVSVILVQLIALYRPFRALAGGSDGWALLWTVLLMSTIGGPLIFAGLWCAFLLVEALAAMPWI